MKNIAKLTSGSADLPINSIKRGLIRPREFLHLLGRELAEIASEDGVLTSAYKARVPIFCPAIADSGIAVGIAGARFEKKNNFMFDIVQDVLDMMNVMVSARVSGIINLGGGTPKSFIQQTKLSSFICKRNIITGTSTRFRSRLTRRIRAADPMLSRLMKD